MNHCQLRNAGIRRHAIKSKYLKNPSLMVLLDAEEPFGDRSYYQRAHDARYLYLNTKYAKFGSQSFYTSSSQVSVYGPPEMIFGTVWTFDCWLRVRDEGPGATGDLMSIVGTTGIQNGWMTTMAQINTSSIRTRLTTENGTYTYVPIGPIDVRQWVHVAVTSDGRTVRTFYNGKFHAARNYSRPIYSRTAPTRHLVATAFLDEVRMMRNECAWITNFTPPEAPYTGRERYNEGQCIMRNAK